MAYMKSAVNDNGAEEGYPEFIYKPINPNQGYDRKMFVDAFDDFSDLSSYLEKLVKDPRDLDTLADLGGLLYQRPDIFVKADDPLLARKEAKYYHSKSIRAMEKYVQNNFETLLGKCDDKGLEGYVISTPIYKTTEGRGQKDHNEFVDRLNSFRKITEIAREGNPEQVREYIAKKISKAPEWLQELIAGSMENQEYAKIMFGAFAERDQKKFFEMLRDKKGKTRRGFLENVVRDSLGEAYKQLGKETNLKDAKDIREKVIRPAYINLAGIAHQGEKAKEKVDRDSSRERRKKLRKELGMAA